MPQIFSRSSVQPGHNAASQSFPEIWWITHEFSPFRGGAAVYVREIARAAAILPVPCRVVAADYDRRLSKPERESMHHTDSCEPCPVVRLKCSGRLTPVGICRFAAGLYALRGQWENSAPVLMSAGAQMAAFLLNAAGKFPVGAATCFFHGSELLRFADHPFWRPLARRFYSRAAGFAVASQYVRGLAIESGLLPDGAEICVAPCAVPSAYRDVSPEGEYGLGADGETIRVMTVGRLHPRKGQVAVAQSLAMLPDDVCRRLIYCVVGTGDPAYRRLVQAVCEGAGLRSEFVPGADDRALAALYRTCTIYAQASQTLPASVEGFGISLLEAGFFGCPIAAFHSGGVAEAVRNGVNSTLVPEGDVAALSAAILALISDADMRRRYGGAGKEFARSFSWPDSAGMLVKYIHNRHPGSPLR